MRMTSSKGNQWASSTSLASSLLETSVSPVARNRYTTSVRKPGEGEEVAEAAPLTRAAAGFFFQFALRRFQRRLLVVDLARRELPDVAIGGVTVLPHEANAAVLVQSDDGGAARVMNDVQGRDVIVRQPDLLDIHLDRAAGENVRDFLDAH